MRGFINELKEASRPKQIFYGVAAMMLPLMIVLGLQAGINGDERFHVRQAEATINWYASLGKDKSFMIPKDQGGMMEGTTTYYYGGLVDITSGLLNDLFGFRPTNLEYHNVRHVVISVFGFIGILFAGLLAQYLMGWEAGILAMILLFATPRFTGHAGFNPKDLPFAVAYLMSVYYMIRFVGEIPKVQRNTAIGMAISIALAINVRVGGILLIAYLGLFTLITIYIRSRKYRKKFKLKNYTKTIKYAALSALGGYFGGMLLWPYGLMNPFVNPFKALTGFTNFHTSMYMLFSGEYITGRQVPWHYIPEWLAITTPVIVLLGFICALYLFKAYAGKWKKQLPIAMMLFVVLFPILYVIYKNSVLYDGLRHLLFVLPVIVVMASVGLYYLYERMNSRINKYVLIGLLTVGILNPVTYIFSNPTLSYTFFNPIIGGIKGALNNYTTDYYMLGAKTAVKKLMEYEDEIPSGAIVGTDCIYPVRAYMREWLPELDYEYMSINGRNDEDWDYGIFFSRFLHPEIIKNGGWPLDLAFDVVSMRGVPLYSIVKKKTKNDYRAMRLIRKNNYEEGIDLLKLAIEEQPTNTMLIRELGRAYMQIGNLSEAQNYLDQALQINSKDYVTLNYYGLVKLRQGQNQEARNYFEKSVQENYQNYLAYYYLALLDKNANLLNQALGNIELCLSYNGGFRPAYELLAEIYEASGDRQRANQIRNSLK